eukprot:TRINITY_DN1765_c0_g1_i1.p1 TRINITY_DN1765_c0_g1~~TRINITY_DN1765_c0_g1_i1.p1  ORF type:complete len:381 (-),score=89.91 TRINITY_DN1765_c0_g1_i1:548-1690(-)
MTVHAQGPGSRTMSRRPWSQGPSATRSAVADATPLTSAVSPVDQALVHGVSSLKGVRPTMEDCHIATTHKASLTAPLVGIYAIFDGHGGALAAETAATLFVPHLTTSTDHFPDGDLALALTATTAACEQAVLEASRSSRSYAGSTLTGMLVRRSELVCFNVGDSRVVLGRRGGTIAEPLSVDHTPVHPEEADRIKKAGGFVKDNRVMGKLATSRSLGDMDYKEHRSIHFPPTMQGEHGPLVTATPDITRVALEEGDDFAILACDGLWSVMANKAAVRLVGRALRRFNDVSAAADSLAQAALQRGSTDNVTVMVVALGWTPQSASPTLGGMFSLHGGSSTSGSTTGSGGGVAPASATAWPRCRRCAARGWGKMGGSQSGNS